MYVLGPLLKELLQNIGPQAQQFLSSPALPQLLNALTKVPPPLIGATVSAVNELPKEVSGWYNSLSVKERKRINNAITWVAKDLSGFAAKELTGLPIDKMVSEYVGTALSAVLIKLETASPPPQQVAYIERELFRALTPGLSPSAFSTKKASLASMTALSASKETASQPPVEAPNDNSKRITFSDADWEFTKVPAGRSPKGVVVTYDYYIGLPRFYSFLLGPENEFKGRPHLYNIKAYCQKMTERMKKAGSLPAGMIVRLPKKAEYKKASDMFNWTPENTLLAEDIQTPALRELRNFFSDSPTTLVQYLVIAPEYS